MVTRIEQPRSRLCVFTLGVVFLAIFVVLLGIGDGAPSVLIEVISLGEGKGLHDTGEGTSYTSIFNLERENQLFWVDTRIGTNPPDLLETIVLELDFEISKEASNTLEEIDSFAVKTIQKCDQEEEWCEWFFVWNRDFVDHEDYHVTVTVPDLTEFLDMTDVTDISIENRVTAINADFTRFELAFKYLWLAVTIMVMFCPCGVGFRSALKRQRKDTGRPRSYHQRWISVLLWALLWFDDPLVAVTVYTDFAPVTSAVFILSASIFVFLILLYWLCFLSDLRFMREGESMLSVRRGICCYWLPKLCLTFAIGVTVFGGYMYYRFENSISFEYTGVSDEKKAAEALAGVLGLLLAVYMLWVLMLVLTSCGRLREVSPSYVLLYFVTLLSCLVAVIGVFVAAYYPYSTSEIAFVSIHGLMNLYVWTIALSFSPTRLEGASEGLGMGDKPMRVETGTAKGRGGWDDGMDSDFKAVEL